MRLRASLAISSERTNTENEPKYNSLGEIKPICFNALKIESPLPLYTTTCDCDEFVSPLLLFGEFDIKTLASYSSPDLSIETPDTIE